MRRFLLDYKLMNGPNVQIIRNGIRSLRSARPNIFPQKCVEKIVFNFSSRGKSNFSEIYFLPTVQTKLVDRGAPISPKNFIIAAEREKSIRPIRQAPHPPSKMGFIEHRHQKPIN